MKQVEPVGAGIYLRTGLQDAKEFVMFQSLCVRARGVVNRVTLAALTVCALVLGTANTVFAQATFPDIEEPIAFAPMAVKVGAFLATAMAIVAAIYIGVVLAKKLLGWIGKGL